MNYLFSSAKFGKLAKTQKSILQDIIIFDLVDIAYTVLMHEFPQIHCGDNQEGTLFS